MRLVVRTGVCLKKGRLQLPGVAVKAFLMYSEQYVGIMASVRR